MKLQYGKDKIWFENEEGEEVGVVEFVEEMKDVVCVTHTIVNERFQGQGIASKLLQALADYLRDNKLKATLQCSYAIKWFMKHEEYQDVLYDLETIKNKQNTYLVLLVV